MPSLHPAFISVDTFTGVLSRYDESIRELSDSKSKGKEKQAPGSTLAELDTFLFGELKDAFKDRQGNYFEKDELTQMIEWKLKHGKWRPNLLALAQSNSAHDVKSITEKALGKLPAPGKPQPKATLTMEVLGDLTKLRGVGPASASLILAIAAPEYAPFFSDECFRWTMVMVEPSKAPVWSRPIKYNVKEYLAYLQGVQNVCKRLKVTALEVERVGWVLGKESAEIAAPETDEVDDEAADKSE